ncbi:2-C-methyl-D-erythritol 4-phosphate cytidylyltransferase [bacterium]|nr:2-C-methyl-D-erythritol 4-phosphate cytidylyltransferase [bacterium]
MNKKIKQLKNYAIILASGSGSRFGSKIPKQFIKIKGKTLLEYSIEAFENHNDIDYIIVVISKEYRKRAEKLINKNCYKKIYALINGGELRKDSSYNGVFSIKDKEANVLIHDCARPFVSDKIISDCVNTLKNHTAVGVAIPTTDTIIKVYKNIIKDIPKRDSLMRIQTPQCFRLSLIKKAHEMSKNDADFTDDCGLVVKYNLADICIVEGNDSNFKITYPNDIIVAKEYLKLKK